MEATLKHFPAGDLTRHTADLFEAATVAPIAITKHRKPRFVVMSVNRYKSLIEKRPMQVAVSVAQMPDDLAQSLDKGIKDYINGD